MKKIYTFLTILFLLNIAWTSQGQTMMPLPAHGSLYSGSARGYWFIAPTSFTITGLRVPPEAGTGLQYIQVMNCHDPFPVAFGTQSANFTNLIYISGAPNGVIQTVNISINAGDTIGIFGTAGTGNSYSVTGPFTSNIAGFTINLTRFGYQGNINTGAAPLYWGEAVGSTGQISRVEMYYTTGPCTDPPTPGNATVSNANPCSGASVSLNLSGNSSGTGQTYQWESGPTPGGPWTPIGSSSTSPSYSTTPPVVTTTYYHNLVTCGSTTVPSMPVSVTVPPIHPGGTFTINASLPTGGSNFTSFTDAIAAIGCGISNPVILNVDSASGPYSEQVTIPAIGSVAIPITINGNGAYLTFAATNPSQPHTFALNGTDYVTVNNLHIEGTGTTLGLACHLWNQADNNTFNNCYFGVPANAIATTQVPFSLSGSESVATTAGISGNNNIISGCTIFSGYYNTCIVGNSAGVNTGNQLLNCHLLDYYLYGSYNTYQSGLIVSGNLIERPSRTTLSTFYGIYVVTGCTNTLVERNIIRNPFGTNPLFSGTAYGIYSSVDGTPGNENKYFNNLIYNMNGIGTIGGMYLTGADYFKAHHNTISIDYAGATAGTTYGIYSTGTVGGKDIRNNIISITRGGTGTKHCLYFSGASPMSDYNDLYITSAATNFTGYFATNFATLANWQAANSSAWDANSKALDPLFANLAGNDVTPTNPLLDDAGTPLGITADFFGNARSLTTPDLGGIEFLNMPLAIKLGHISAANVGPRNRIDWNTISEENAAIFTLERSTDGKIFTALSTIIAKGSASAYIYWDEEAVTGVNYYRLKITDLSGRNEYSKWVTAIVKGSGTFGVEAFPNPATDLLSVRVTGTVVSEASLSISDIRGRIVRSYIIKSGIADIDLTSLSPGMYMLTYSDDANRRTIKFTKK